AAPWVGGKRLLAKRVIARQRTVDHSCYVEPFVGMGGIFLRRDFAPACEVINDYDREVANFFRVLQRHYVAFLDMLKWQLTSRSEFERLLQVDPDTQTDLERAARFLYLQKTVFGGKPQGNFGVSRTNSARFDLTKLVPVLEDVFERLNRVVIECLPWQAVIDRYDTVNTLFYLDPPYYGTEDYYQAAFGRGEFTEMAARLRNLKGKFILSLNDCSEVREIFSNFDVEKVAVTYSLSKKTDARGQRGELLISN
ncbi:DNA adenine methylase, partial [Bombella apis]|uniref:DNA adenine methylase n=1 Tax=Bombella apis TaxID=1785988 RepID=UPI0012B7160A